VRQLLSHTAGAPNPPPLRWIQTSRQPDGQAAELTRRLRDRARPRRPVGGPARYSNLGYLLLADIVAAAAGEPFEHYVHHAVLQPAGMSRTGYIHRPDVQYATGYVRMPRPLTPLLRAALPAGSVGKRHGEYVALARFRVAGAGYGGLIGDVLDAARLLRLHLADGVIDGHRILAADTARDMRTIRFPGKPFDHGLGWFRPPAHRYAQPSFVEHWGTGGGFWNAMRLYPDLDLGIVIMANTTNAYDHDAIMQAAARTFAP
jgi:CubicO group peptidase (beta-lactamase class C family)